jgi:hypothetical protein
MYDTTKNTVAGQTIALTSTSKNTTTVYLSEYQSTINTTTSYLSSYSTVIDTSRQTQALTTFGTSKTTETIFQTAAGGGTLFNTTKNTTTAF